MSWLRSRFWYYTRSEWTPERRWRLFKGSDYPGKVTLVFPVPFAGYLVWHYWTCKCCRDQQTWEHEKYGVPHG